MGSEVTEFRTDELGFAVTSFEETEETTHGWKEGRRHSFFVSLRANKTF